MVIEASELVSYILGFLNLATRLRKHFYGLDLCTATECNILKTQGPVLRFWNEVVCQASCAS